MQKKTSSSLNSRQGVTSWQVDIDNNDDGGGSDDDRVAKCHGYGRYICVKILEDWGKKFGRLHRFVIWGSFEVNFTNCYEVLSLNHSYLIELSPFHPRFSQLSPFC